MDHRAVVSVRGGRERGAGTVEYVGIIIAVAVLVGALVVAVPSFGTSIADTIKKAICEIGGGGGCGTGDQTADEGQGAEDGENGNGAEEPPPTADVPSGLDPASDLVQAMQSTERGREILQWLADNNIPIVVDNTVTGAYWDGTQIVLGAGLDDAGVLVHEANHARYSNEGRTADAATLSRADYVDGMTSEETDGVVQQIEAAQEFRAAGHNVPPQVGETQYDNAYQAAKANGASDAEARQAGRDAIRQEFDNGGFVTSTNGKTYPDYYGDYWDSVH